MSQKWHCKTSDSSGIACISGIDSLHDAASGFDRREFPGLTRSMFQKALDSEIVAQFLVYSPLQLLSDNRL